MLMNQRRILVEWGDCDPAGIVYYPRYLAWFDDCTSALFASAGLPIQNLFKSYGIFGVPLVDVKARFLVASTYGDELLAESTVTEFRGSSFVVRHNFFKEKALAVEGYEIRVWAGHDPNNPERMKSQKLPREVIERFTSPATPAA
jgi:4-hydroxybenzoyl-CoA thioesterase